MSQRSAAGSRTRSARRWRLKRLGLPRWRPSTRSPLRRPPPPLMRRYRRAQPLPCFDRDHQRDHHQRQSVEERDEDAYAMIAEGAALIGGALGLDGGEPRQPQRNHIGQDMASVREQRKGVREQPANHLDDQNRRRQQEAQPQRLASQRMVMSGARAYARRCSLIVHRWLYLRRHTRSLFARDPRSRRNPRHSALLSA